MSDTKENEHGVEKISFRLFAPYTHRIVQQAALARLTPNQFARLATMAMVDSGLLNVPGKLTRIESDIKRLRQELLLGEILRSPTTH